MKVFMIMINCKNIITTLLLGFLPGCVLPSSSPPLTIIHLLQSPLQTPLSFSVNQGERTPAVFTMAFHWPASDGFGIKAAQTVSDLQSFQLYLVTNNSGTLTPAYGPFIMNKSGIVNSGDSQTIAFTNVRPGAFYVAAAAFDAIDGGGNNITHLNSGATIGGSHYFVTDGGGESPTYPGRVTISNTYQVTGTAQLTLTLRLQDG